MQDHFPRQDSGDAEAGRGGGSFFPGADAPRGADHPRPETIVAYRRGLLDEREMESLQEHLVSCEDCLDRLLLDGDESDKDPGVLDFEKEMIWARLRAAKAEDEVGEVQKRAAKARAERRSERLGVAAAILALAVPLGGFGFHQRNVISELTRPQLNVSIHDVLKNGHRGVRGSDSEPMVFEIPQGTQFYTVVFPVEGRQEDTHDVEIVDSRNQPLWSGRGLEIDEFGYATLGLSRRFLDAGPYRIRVYSRGEGRQTVGDFPIVIRNL